MHDLYCSIVEQIHVESDSKYYGTIQTYLQEIEKKNMKQSFTNDYIELQDKGYHPYDCLVKYCNTCFS